MNHPNILQTRTFPSLLFVHRKVKLTWHPCTMFKIWQLQRRKQPDLTVKSLVVPELWMNHKLSAQIHAQVECQGTFPEATMRPRVHSRQQIVWNLRLKPKICHTGSLRASDTGSPPFPQHVLFRVDILKAELEQSISPPRAPHI